MHVISRKPFRDATDLYPNSRTAIEDCYRVLSSGTFRTPDELRQVFPSLDNFKYRD
jgi:mRNA interferase HigB